MALRRGLTTTRRFCGLAKRLALFLSLIDEKINDLAQRGPYAPDTLV